MGLLLLWHGRDLLRRAGGPGRLIRRVGALGTVGAPGGGVLLAGYLGMSLITASGAGTLGGNHNHLLDLTAACCLGLALLAGALRAARGAGWRVGAAAGALALAALTPGLYDTPHWLGHELRVPAAQDEGMRNIAQYTSNTPGPVYSTNLSVLLVTDKWKLNLWTTIRIRRPTPPPTIVGTNPRWSRRSARATSRWLSCASRLTTPSSRPRVISHRNSCARCGSPTTLISATYSICISRTRPADRRR